MLAIEGEQAMFEYGHLENVIALVGDNVSEGDIIATDLHASPICISLRVTPKGTSVPTDVRPYLSAYVE